MASISNAALKQRHMKPANDDVNNTQHFGSLDNPFFEDEMMNKKLYPESQNDSFDLQLLYLRFQRRHPYTTAWLLYLGFLFSLIFFACQIHYALPSPVPSELGAVLDPATGLYQHRFSEENVRKIVRHLSEDIGYRIVGTEQDQETQEYLINELKQLKEQAQQESTKLRAMQSDKDVAIEIALPQFDMWVQVEDGSHQFDFMSKVVMKMYTNMTNIIVRLSCGPECDKNAILLNAHYDTTLGSPGAVDDALPVGVMMEIIRIVSQRPTLKKNSLIFLFNGGEESLQDASHSFITMHELRHSIRAVINLEGCGTSGPEILFQANSKPMIEAYSRVPYPHGNVMGNDLFSTGVVLSDTDFRQFVDYGNLTGLDLAVYKNSYLYHTHLDLDELMERGLPQHIGENTLALATYLADEVDLTSSMERTKAVVYFDVFGQFFVSYSMETAIMSHIFIGVLVVITLVTGASRPTVRSLVSVVLSFISALLTPLFSVIMIQALGKSMIWFSNEWLPVVIFGPLSAAGMLYVQWLFHNTRIASGTNELNTLSSIQVSYTIAMAAASVLGIASSYFLAIYSLFTSVALIFNHKRTASQKKSGVDYTAYYVASAIQTFYCSHLAFSLYDLIVPLTGRIGVDAPVDHIIAIMTGFTIVSFSPPLLAFSHRFGCSSLKRAISRLVVLQIVIILVCSAILTPYDTLHPKRVFAQHMRNLTSGESLMYVAHADAGPFYSPYITQIESLYDTKATFRSGNGNNGDWKSVYPFNQFLDSYVFDTTPYIRKHTTNATLSKSSAPLTDLIQRPPVLYSENVSYNPETGLRKLTILCTHPNYIWTVTSFDAEVVSWSMKLEVPSKEKFHYVVRHAGGYKSDGWRLDLEYRAAGIDDKLRVELTAMETEGFGRDIERELEGSGDIGVMRRLVKARPDDVSLTYFSSVLSNFDL
ncbi:hypothetical protein BGZ79_010651 [Entomortierella chlamydospora]|nr:hypothetical protein BGZ79_010651 [Entomortierella chlamydospora]